MHTSYLRLVPTEHEPLPEFVRREIHNLLRNGFVYVSAAPFTPSDTDLWSVVYRDGTQERAVLIYRVDVAVDVETSPERGKAG
jgi:hypothetical protein